MARIKLVDGEPIEFTAEEETARDAEEASWESGKFNRALNSFRITRNELLAKTDWTSGSDLTMSDEMKTYRQQLRDATNGLDTVEKVEAYTFPTEVTK